MKERLTVVKVGGQVVENETALASLLQWFTAIDTPKLLVHGGGKSATRLASQLGIETKMLDGRRITDARMLEIVTMVYGGGVNKHIVASLQALGINAIGLTGADMNVIRAHKRSVGEVDYGFVGDIDYVDGKCLSELITKDIVPVIAPLTHDGKGTLLNTNADTIALETARSLTDRYDVTLHYLFEKKGVLLMPDDEDSFIPVLCREEYERLIADGIVRDGMIPKLQNAFSALDKGIKRVFISNTEIVK
ncbi:MAG: acetylglutamate kinase [Prevotella sp.]|nr:acetylglutamate kinase [Candidatus Equicola faecalis]